jgi:spore germination protein KC
MRKFVFLTVLFTVSILLTCCTQIAQGRTEIDKLFIARIMSIDEAENGKVKVTLTTKSLSTGGDGKGQQEKSESIVSEGYTLAEAQKNLIVHTDKRPSFGHTEYILFGESIAKKGISPYLDYISRYNEFRYNAKIYIVKGDSANSVVRKSNTAKLFAGDRISANENNAILTSLSSTVTLNEALMILDNKNLNVFIPYIEMSNAMLAGESGAKYDILLNGYALLKKDKLSYFTSTEEARGINWMMNRIGSGVILVKSGMGEDISLTIVNGKTKVKPKIMGNELHCNVNIFFSTNISEIMGNKSILDHESIEHLISLQNKAIEKEVGNAISIAQKNNSDHFSIISKFIIEYPMMKDYFMENWKDLFPNIKFNISAQSRIKGTYMINEPAGSTDEVKGE